MTLARRLFILVALLCGGFAANSTHAQLLCTATSTGMSFGSYSPVGAAPSTSATIGIKCTGLLAKARMCVSIGPGVEQTSYSPRYMSRGTGTLTYNLYSDSAGTSVIGSTFTPAGFPMAVFDLPVSAGKVDTSVTIYCKVMPSQTSVVAGS